MPTPPLVHAFPDIVDFHNPVQRGLVDRREERSSEPAPAGKRCAWVSDEDLLLRYSRGETSAGSSTYLRFDRGCGWPRAA
jgi:hypothetical protein